jgi:hypothetical protein
LIDVFSVLLLIFTMERSKASALYEALRSQERVNIFRNVDYQFGYHGAIIVSVGLQLNPTLLCLSLFYNDIGDSGAAAIAEALKLNTGLHEVNLCDNIIGGAGAAAIATRVCRNLSFAAMDLEMLVPNLLRKHSR